MNLDDIYTPLEEAKEEIQRRWEDKELKKKVDEFLGGDIPDFLQDSPKAYLARHIASPNFEFFYFKDLADKIGLEFVISEFTNDIFTPENTSKYHLGKMFLEGRVGKKGGKEIVTELVIDFNNSNGKRIKDVMTIDGDNLTDFHHRLLNQSQSNIKLRIHDFSDWLKKYDSDPKKFYLYFLALFIRNGILFENFLLNREEEKFTIENVFPNFEFLTKKFGVRPIIVRLLPKNQEEDIHWFCYTNNLRDNI